MSSAPRTDDPGRQLWDALNAEFAAGYDPFMGLHEQMRQMADEYAVRHGKKYWQLSPEAESQIANVRHFLVCRFQVAERGAFGPAPWEGGHSRRDYLRRVAAYDARLYKVSRDFVRWREVYCHRCSGKTLEESYKAAGLSLSRPEFAGGKDTMRGAYQRIDCILRAAKIKTL